MATNLKVVASTSQFNSQVRQMTQELKALQSSFGVASTQAKLFGNSTEQLKTKQNELTAKMQVQNNMSKAQEGLVNKLTGDLDKQKNKRAELASKIEETNKKYKESVAATGKNSEESKKLKQELTGLKEEYARNNKAIESTNKQLQNAEIKLNKTKKSILENKKALEEVNKKLKDIKLDKFQKSMEKTSDVTGKISSKMKPLAIGITGAGVVASKFSLDFQDGLANINTLLDNQSHLDGYKNKITEVSNQTGMDIKIVTDGMYQAISSIGDGGKETEKIFDTMAKGAKAGGAEVKDSVALISAGMKGYGQVNDETAKKISDLAFQTAKLGVTTFPEMASSMQPLFPLASGLNVKMTDLYGSMATLTGVTGNTSEVSTQLKAVFSNLMRPTTDMQKVMKKYGYQNGQAMIKAKGLGGVLKIVQKETGGQSDKMAKLFSSTEATTAMTALCGENFNDFTSKTKEMEKATGSTDRALAKINKTAGNDLRTSLNEAKNSMIGFGDVLSPFISLAAKGISGISKAFSGLSEGQKKVFVGIGAGIVGFTGLFFGISKVTGAISEAIINYKKIRDVIKAWQVATKLQTAAQTALNIVMNMNPIGLVVIAVAALVAGLVVLYKHCKPFQQFIDGIGKSIANFVKSIPARLHLLKVKLIRDVTALRVKGHQFLEKVKQKITQFGRNVKYGITHFPEIIGRTIGVIAAYIYTGIMNAKNFVFHTVPETMKAVFNWFWELPGKIWTALCQAVTKVTQWGVNTYHAATTAASNTIKAVFNWFKQLPGKIWNGLVDAYHKVIEWGSNLWSAGKNAGSQLVHSVVDTVSSLPSRMLDIGRNIVHGIWNGICGAAGWLKSQVSSFCSGVVDGFKSALGIHSPSRVLRDEVGKFMAQGVGVGFIGEMQQVNSNIEQTLNRTINTRIVPSLNADQLQSINARVNDNSNNDIFVIVQNVTNIDGETVSTKIYKKVAKKINGEKNDYKVTKGVKGRLGYV